MQPLAFAYMLVGGLFIVSAVENIPMGELVKHGLKGAKLPSRKGAAFTPGAAGSTGGAGGETGGGAGTGTSTQAPTLGAKASPPAKAAGEAIFNENRKKLEHFLHRPLTPKELNELHQVQREGKL